MDMDKLQFPHMKERLNRICRYTVQEKGGSVQIDLKPEPVSPEDIQALCKVLDELVNEYPDEDRGGSTRFNGIIGYVQENLKVFEAEKEDYVETSQGYYLEAHIEALDNISFADQNLKRGDTFSFLVLGKERPASKEDLRETFYLFALGLMTFGYSDGYIGPEPSTYSPYIPSDALAFFRIFPPSTELGQRIYTFGGKFTRWEPLSMQTNRASGAIGSTERARMLSQSSYVSFQFLKGALGPHSERNELNWSTLSALELIKNALKPLQEFIENPDIDTVSWGNPFVESQYPVEWTWEHKGEVSGTFTLEDVKSQKALSSKLDENLSRHDDLTLFRIRTDKTAIIKRDNTYTPLAPREQIRKLQDLPDEEREALLAEIYRPYTIDAIQDTPYKAPFYVEVAGVWIKGCIAIQFHPLMLDEDDSRAYYPVVIGFLPEDPVHLSSVSPEDRRKFWLDLEDYLDQTISRLSVFKTKPSQFASKDLPTPKIVPVRSVMNPVPMPRGVPDSAMGLSLTRGLGKMFTHYSKIPDLDINGDIATNEAQARFWPLLEEYLDKAVSQHPSIQWEKRKEGSSTIYVLYGMDKQKARALWAEATKAMNKGEGGPGLEVAAPTAFEDRSRFDNKQGAVLTETRIVLWPDDSVKITDGQETPPVRFRNERSPGYLELLERHGPRPFFADGWLWIPRGEEREGFRIGGLPRLLFPEGLAALERINQEKKKNYENELNRIYRNPSLFQHEDEQAKRDLRAAIRRVDAMLENLTLFEIGHDLILCIFEAFYRQRNLWFHEKVALFDGMEIGTKPWRVIRLDPSDLRIRLDPKKKWGTNWRNRLFEKLEILTTFERQTRTQIGRTIDAGDRFLVRLIDGHRGADETSSPETDSGLGLTRILKRAGAFPVNAFFAEISVDFMERLVTWAVDENGVVQWGLAAANAAQSAHLATHPEDTKGARQLGEAKRKQARSKPYYEHSPRMLAVSRMEDWPENRKFLAGALLQEKTPNLKKTRKEKHRIVTIEGDSYIACNGSRNHGYRVKIWMKKAGYEKRPGPGGGRDAYRDFVEDLRGLVESLDLKIQIKKGGTNTDEVLKTLETFKDNPKSVNDIFLLIFLPADTEKRLTERLAGAGIEAVDKDDPLPAILRKSNPDELSPAELRQARLQAGMTQAQLAEKIGVSRPIIVYWENAKRPIPEERMTLLMEILKPHLDRPEI